MIPSGAFFEERVVGRYRLQLLVETMGELAGRWKVAAICTLYQPWPGGEVRRITKELLLPLETDRAAAQAHYEALTEAELDADFRSR